MGEWQTAKQCLRSGNATNNCGETEDRAKMPSIVRAVKANDDCEETEDHKIIFEGTIKATPVYVYLRGNRT